MNVVLCMVSSLNGYVARADGSMDWTSAEDKQWFVSLAQEIGVLISGKKTYEVARKQGLLPIKLRVVVTHHPEKEDAQPNTLFTSATPQKILAIIQDRGFDRVLIAGGGEINSLFLKENLIDELYVTIEPVLLGHGVPLFAPKDMESRLKLLAVKNLNEHTIQLHYQVIK